MGIDKIKEMLASQLNIKEEQIKEESRIIEDLGADSLDVVELLMSLEDQLQVSITDEEAGQLKTVGDIVSIVDKKAPKNNKK